MFVRIQRLTFSIYANTNVMQRLVNIGKPYVLFLNKTKHMMKSSMHVTYVIKFSILQTFKYQTVTDDPIY